MTNEIFTEKALNLDVTDFEQLKTHLLQVQETCREKWSTFNVNYCLTGLFLISFSIMNLMLFLAGFRKNYSLEYLQQTSVQILKPISFFSVIYLVTSIFISPGLVFVPLIVVCLNGCLFYILKSNLKNFRPDSLLKYDYIFYALILLIPFSNSYIVQENVSLRFIFISALLFEFYKRLQAESQITARFFFKKFGEIAALVAIIRITEIFYVCREEALLLNCTQNIFSTQISKMTDYSINIYFMFTFLNLLVMSSVLYNLLWAYLTKTWINLLILFKVFTIFAYWLIQIKTNQSTADNRLFFNQLGLYLARLFYVLFTISQFFLWKFTDKCYLKLFTYVLTTFGLLASILSGESVTSIWILIQVLILYARHRSSWNSEVKVIDFSLILILLQHYFFYATGHESVFTHIKWEAGFHGFESENSNPVIRVFVMIFILLNTFSSNLIVVVGGIGLLNNHDLFNTDIKYRYRNHLRSILGFYTLNSVKVSILISRVLGNCF